MYIYVVNRMILRNEKCKNIVLNKPRDMNNLFILCLLSHFSIYFNIYVSSNVLGTISWEFSVVTIIVENIMNLAKILKRLKMKKRNNSLSFLFIFLVYFLYLFLIFWYKWKKWLNSQTNFLINVTRNMIDYPENYRWK